jgi:hypothetical protein
LFGSVTRAETRRAFKDRGLMSGRALEPKLRAALGI